MKRGWRNRKKKKRVVFGSSEDRATLHQIQLLFNLGRLKKENSLCNNTKLQNFCLSHLPADFVCDLLSVKDSLQSRRTPISVDLVKTLLSRYAEIMVHDTLSHTTETPGLSVSRLQCVCKNRKGAANELHILLCAILRAVSIPTRVVCAINPTSWRRKGSRKKRRKKESPAKRRRTEATDSSGSSTHKLSKAVSSKATKDLLLKNTKEIL